MDNNNYANDNVYIKMDIKIHRIYENHPNLMFGIIILIWGILFVLAMYFMKMILFWVLICLLAPITIWYIKNNEKTNLTKSSAFVERDGIIYYIRLGYMLDYQQPEISVLLGRAYIDSTPAEQNMRKTKYIQKIRQDRNTFSKALTEALNSNHLPADIVEFCEMRDCQLEEETKQWVWLSYHNGHTKNQRVTQKFRNVYDFSFVKR
ncbi:MAG: DUF3811 domain-containing protein [Clostridiaceae bacterium]|nr:DUF3811 domain-containing protein [Clostridiaceae bacterium]